MHLRSLSFQFLCSHSKLPVVGFHHSSPFRNQEPHVLKAWKSLSLASSTTWSSWHLMQVIWWSVLSAYTVVLCRMQFIHLYTCSLHSYLVTLKANCQDWDLNPQLHQSPETSCPENLVNPWVWILDYLDILKTDSAFLISHLISGACLLVCILLSFDFLFNHSKRIFSEVRFEPTVRLHSETGSLHWTNFKVPFKAVAMSGFISCGIPQIVPWKGLWVYIVSFTRGQ